MVVLHLCGDVLAAEVGNDFWSSRVMGSESSGVEDEAIESHEIESVLSGEGIDLLEVGEFIVTRTVFFHENNKELKLEFNRDYCMWLRNYPLLSDRSLRFFLNYHHIN